MASTLGRHIRIDGIRIAALEALAYDRHSNTTAEVTAAIDHRLAQWRSGELPEHEDAKRGELLEWDLYARISDERHGALRALAEERDGSAAREIRAAIDDHLTLWRAGRLKTPEPPADPGPIVVPDKRPWSRPDALEDSRESERADHGRTSRQDCAHPKSRVHKGLCHACGSPV
jgi:hypothetical protein